MFAALIIHMHVFHGNVFHVKTPFLTSNLLIPLTGNHSGTKQVSQVSLSGLLMFNPLLVSHSINVY